MTDKKERRNAAIQALKFRDEKAKQLIAEKERKVLEEKERLKNLISTWTEKTSTLIVQTFTEINRDLSNQQSPLLFILMPTPAINTGPQPLSFGLKVSASYQPEAILEFRLNDAMQVSTTINIPKTALPSSTPMEEVTADWIDEVADTVLIALSKSSKK